MRDQLKAIEDLQKIDLQIAELLRGGAENPHKLAELEAQVGAARAAVEVEKTRLAEIERQKKALEEQLGTDKDKVKKWEARLSEQRSTREYSALAREIDIAKKQNTTASEEIVELAKQAEVVRGNLDGKQAAYEAVQKELAGRMQTIRKAMAEIDGQRKALDEKRADAAKHLAPVMLRRYETIQKRRGSVLVPLINGACRGCHMNVPPQMYNELRTNARVDVCPSCGRMIYSPEAFGGEIGAQA